MTSNPTAGEDPAGIHPPGAAEPAARRAERTLAHVALFRDLAPDALEALSARCRWRRFSSREEILRYGDETTDVFFIVRGRVRVTYYSLAGKEVMFRDLSAGELFGEMSAIDGEPRSASVIALTDTLLAMLTATQFWDVLRSHEAVNAAVMRRLAGLVRGLTMRVVEASTLAVRSRIHAEMLRLARAATPVGNRAVIAKRPTHAEIASRIGTHREAVTRELNQLLRDGVLEKHGSVLVVSDIAALERMIEDVKGD
ncbi:Crp/Fnr family transcriptional regulator [Arenibaculum pallidiluteum]|uniref:Crp/Fnr family transcriptional regulator n=1 Tax=Arenibaculum pallidiluteum TaxID=2812559 RepID=UPI001A975B6A|nr:Crp/Fnr family transcriptional regulator [Arenibaculum pallidiluteum]